MYVNDPEFDNDDNPYASIKLHKYINMNNENDTDVKNLKEFSFASLFTLNKDTICSFK